MLRSLEEPHPDSITTASLGLESWRHEPARRGHEQQGTRPCVVVSDAAVNSNQRFPLIAVIPITGTPAPGALYPMLEPGSSGLSKPSTGVMAGCPRRSWRSSTRDRPTTLTTVIEVGSVPTSVRLDPAIEARLDQLVEVTGRSKAYYLRELIEQGIDDLEDAYLGAAVLERIRSGKEQTCSLNDVMTELDLDASDL